MSMKILFSMALASLALIAPASEGGQRDVFQKWHISVGGAFNGGLGAHLSVRNAPVPSVTAPAIGAKRRSRALEDARRHVYDGGGFIRTDSDNDGTYTTNWKLPEDDYYGNGRFLLENAYSEVSPGEVSQSGGDSSCDPTQFGIAVEFSRELWIHDENEEHRWGVDFAAAFSYFFKRGVYRASGRTMRTDLRKDGVFTTPVEDPDAMFFYDMGWDSPQRGMYGHGNWDVLSGGPALQFAGIGDPTEDYTETPCVSSRGFSSSGDYRELEMLFMFRPWYEITDWWRVFGEVGLGVSWGRFDSAFSSAEISSREKSTQWDLYGVVGLGTVFRYDDWTLGADFIGRFWRDDFEVDGRYVNGSIERADWGFRIMLGYEF